MATATSSSSHDRFSRVGLRFGQKAQPELRGRAPVPKMGSADEDWYIPYTGPYEAPPKSRFAKKNRDSWGDPIFDVNNAQSVEPTSPYVRYEDDSSDAQEYRSSEESRIRGRGRSQSVASAFTTSTGMDHSRPSYSTQRQSNVSSPQRPAIPSYANLDAGGVGESPVPVPRQAKNRPLSHRASLGSLFNTFGIKSPSGPGFTDHRVKSPSRKRSLKLIPNSGVDAYSNKVMSTNYHERTASGDSHIYSINAKRDIRDPPQSVDPQMTAADDYYNSYYSTLIQTPVKPQHSAPAKNLSHLPTSNPSPSRPNPSTSHHPYAFIFPEVEDLTTPTKSNSAPPSAGVSSYPAIAPKLTFSENNALLPHPNNHLKPDISGAQRRDLKGSVSTPNFMSAKSNLSASRTLPRGIDRWLSAETWCDALLFPRPRLKVKNERSDTRRIVSPPASPVLPSDPWSSDQTDSVPSRVLVHSRSLASLREKNEAPWQRKSQPLLHPPSSSQQAQSRGEENAPQTVPNGHLRPPRPKSWAQDDLDLPSPVPSLAKVLEDGERLETERKDWQNKALGSLGNKRARSVSRSRSKSLTAKGRRTQHQVQSNIDFLAARAVHGNQDAIPVLPSVSKFSKSQSQKGTVSQSSHSRNTSNAQTQTHTSSMGQSLIYSSRSHSRDHSRNDSWGKHALKAVKSAVAPYRNPDVTITSTGETGELEGATQRADIKNVRPADPILGPDHPSPLSPPSGPSPTPSGLSGVSDPRVGIAISTPLTDELATHENIRLPSHPYAQGGLYAYNEPHISHEKRAEYAGPHPVQTIRTAEVPDGPAARHKLPPHVTLSHPYAHAHSNRDSYAERLIQHPRPESDVPPPAKMWAQMAPGVVREILPTELRYSPFIDGDGNMEGDMAMAMAASGIVDTMGVGEALALAYAVERPEGDSARDSGIGTSENAHVPGTQVIIVEPDAADAGDLTARLGSPSRMPVQYDIMRPTHRLQRVMNSSETGHTFKSSPLEYHTMPSREYVRNTGETGFIPSPLISSDTSSQQNSPRPLGSPNDLVGFQDLFYKPGTGIRRDLRQEEHFGDHSPNGSRTLLSNIPLDLSSPHQRPTSGLTSLARKLSEEYEQLSIAGRSSSQYSQSSTGASGSSRPPNARKPTDGSLEFVFEEMAHPDSPIQGIYTNESTRPGVVLPFEPEENIPEDVESISSSRNRGSDEDGNTTEVFHIKQVETGTPAAVNSDRRLSFTGQLGYQTERHEVSAPHSIAGTSRGNETDALSAISSPKLEARILSGLQPPLTDATRSSYITTSTMSRMSGLSDFPIPPKDLIVNHRTSLLSTFFADANDRPPMPVPQLLMSQDSNHNNRLTFGAGADAEEIVRALSNHPTPF